MVRFKTKKESHEKSEKSHKRSSFSKEQKATKKYGSNIKTLMK
jgi:hypothetical protein